ncbi:MAG TPA: hypothetical protein VHI77_00935 [Solirubrobacterales bacterium]|jgi:hypothetical protein|nr:hypothetical protein [Solirubrobacterales bacterium]
MRLLRRRLTYANVIATLALFLALTGGVVWAAGKIGSKRLKKNAVTTAKIKRSAVTSAKLKNNAVTTPKLKGQAVSTAKLAEGAVNFAKLAPGASVVASASGGPALVNSVNSAIPIPLSGTAGFTPATGVTDLVNVEARAIDLARSGAEPCAVVVQPLVNGQLLRLGSGFLDLTAAPTGGSDFSPVSLASASGPVGLAQPGVPQQISMRVIGDTDCTAGSQVAVSVTVTQFK